VLTIVAVAHPMGDSADIVFCRAAVEVDLVNNHSHNSVYSDEFAQKGGGTNYDNAGRKAFEAVADEVSDKIITYINN
jgi:hypothetical protein